MSGGPGLVIIKETHYQGCSLGSGPNCDCRKQPCGHSVFHETVWDLSETESVVDPTILWQHDSPCSVVVKLQREKAGEA